MGRATARTDPGTRDEPALKTGTTGTEGTAEGEADAVATAGWIRGTEDCAGAQAAGTVVSGPDIGVVKVGGRIVGIPVHVGGWAVSTGGVTISVVVGTTTTGGGLAVVVGTTTTAGGLAVVVGTTTTAGGLAVVVGTTTTAGGSGQG